MVQKSSTFHEESESGKKFGARAFPRALRALEYGSKSEKWLFFHESQNFPRAPEISSDLKSAWKIDDFCTKNEFKKVKIRN